MARGQLRIYLGAAPGVGKTFAMLQEAHRRKGRGTDVVVGFIESHGRQPVEELIGALEVIPRKTISYRGTTFTEMDTDAILARRPQVVLVDELAHTNVPGSPTAKRWQDVQRLVDAGITVLSTVNIQHLESLNDVVEQITGVPQRETVPDEVVRRADQVQLVDMTPEALRRRMAHGNIYPAQRIDAALGAYFRVGNLTALRELALLWLADKVDEQLDRYRAEHEIGGTWEARERVVVALTGGPEGETLIRRASRIANRTKGADLLAVHVARSDGLSGADPALLARQRTLVESLGGSYHQVVGNDVPAALLDFARAVNATQLVLGASRRGRLAQLLSPGIGVTTTRRSGPIDVHLVTHEEIGRGRDGTARRLGLPTGRRLAGLLLTAVSLPLLTLLLRALQEQLSLPTHMLAYLLVVVAAALVGGWYPALLAAVASSLLLSYYFTPPMDGLIVAERENVFALATFVLVAIAVSTVVDLAARRTIDAARARAEAETLSTLAGSVLRGERPLMALLERVRETFNLTSVTLLEARPDAPHAGPERQRDPAAWQIAATVGGPPSRSPVDGDVDVPIGEDLALVLRGRVLAAEDQRVVAAFAAQAAVALNQQQLTERAATASSLAEVDRLRTAMLTAVSHDLRTPLSAAMAAVDGLCSKDVVFTQAERSELLTTVAESLDRLNRLVDNLLDMSRLQTGALGMYPQLVSVAEVIPRALDDLGGEAAGIEICTPDDLPEVLVDAALLGRVLVNLLSNAVRHSPADQPPMIIASEHGGFVEVRVVDHGPDIPAADRERVFMPYQRLGDHTSDAGVGLGLTLSRGLAEAMGGSLVPDLTPGGGLTMTLSLPATERGAGGAADPAIVERVAHWRQVGSGEQKG